MENRSYYPDAPDYEEPFMVKDMENRHEEKNYHGEMQSRQYEKQQEKHYESQQNIHDKKELEKSNSKKIYKLKNPIQFEGDFIEEISLDFESLTGRDTIEASSHATGVTMMMEFDRGFLAAIVAKAAGMPYEFMTYISAKDFMELTNRAAAFLL